MKCINAHHINVKVNTTLSEMQRCTSYKYHVYIDCLLTDLRRFGIQIYETTKKDFHFSKVQQLAWRRNGAALLVTNNSWKTGPKLNAYRAHLLCIVSAMNNDDTDSVQTPEEAEQIPPDASVSNNEDDYIEAEEQLDPNKLSREGKMSISVAKKWNVYGSSERNQNLLHFLIPHHTY